VAYPSVLAVIGIVNVALRYSFITTTIDPKLINAEDVQECPQMFQVQQGSGPERFPGQGFEAFPYRAVSFLVLIFKALLHTNHFRTECKYVRVISILKPGKDPTLPSSYRPICFLDSIGKLFEKVLVTRILIEVSV